MTTRLRKTRKMRGSRTHGWGRSGQHRDHGMLGGHRKSGWKWKRMRSKLRERRRGKLGFRCPTGMGYVSTLNVGHLSDLLERTSSSAEKGESISVVDLKELGCWKLLGRGKITKPVTVRVAQYSSVARKKIEEAGGKILAADRV